MLRNFPATQYLHRLNLSNLMFFLTNHGIKCILAPSFDSVICLYCVPYFEESVLYWNFSFCLRRRKWCQRIEMTVFQTVQYWTYIALAAIGMCTFKMYSRVLLYRIPECMQPACHPHSHHHLSPDVDDREWNEVKFIGFDNPVAFSKRVVYSLRWKRFSRKALIDYSV
jgi:hypothetical protein